MNKPKPANIPRNLARIEVYHCHSTGQILHRCPYCVWVRWIATGQMTDDNGFVPLDYNPHLYPNCPVQSVA